MFFKVNFVLIVQLLGLLPHSWTSSNLSIFFPQCSEIPWDVSWKSLPWLDNLFSLYFFLKLCLNIWVSMRFWTVYLSAWFLNSAVIWKSICSTVHLFTDTVQQWNYSRTKKRVKKQHRFFLMNVRPLDNVKIIHDKGYQSPIPSLQYRLQSSTRYELMFLGNGVKV